MRVIQHSTTGRRRTDHESSFDYRVYCFFGFTVAIDATFSMMPPMFLTHT